MEQYIEFNGVRVVLTTGQTLDEVQSFTDVADVIISVYPGDTRVLRGTSQNIIRHGA
jgi:hypothetical protein